MNCGYIFWKHNKRAASRAPEGAAQFKVKKQKYYQLFSEGFIHT